MQVCSNSYVGYEMKYFVFKGGIYPKQDKLLTKFNLNNDRKIF